MSSNYFSTIGVTLPLGPGFTKVDDASRAEPEAVIGHRVWQTRFNSDPAIVGRTLTINQTSYVVAGVAPETFRGHKGGLNDSHYQLWLPLTRHPRLIANEGLRLARDTAWVQILARLPEGTTVRQADAIAQSAVAALATRHPSTTRDKTGGAEPYFPAGARLRSQVSFARLMVLGLSGIVLLVVGLNISGMMLVRSAMRRARAGRPAGDGREPLAPRAASPERSAGDGLLGGSLASAVAVRRADGRGLGSRRMGTGARSVRARSVARAPVVACASSPAWCWDAAGVPLQPARR